MSAECQRCGWDLPYDGDCVVCDENGTFCSQLLAERGHLEAAAALEAAGKKTQPKAKVHSATCWSKQMCVPCTKNVLTLAEAETAGLASKLLEVQQEAVDARKERDVEVAKRIEAIDGWDRTFREMEGLAKQFLAERNEAREERDDVLISRQGEQDKLSRVLAALPAIIFGVVYYDLGEHGVTWERCVEKWEKYWKPALLQAHSGSCTNECHSCARCQAEDVMRLFAIVRAGLG